MKKFISHQMSPNFQRKDAWFAFQQIGKKSKEKDHSKIFETTNYKIFNTGRSAIGAIIDTLQFSKNKKIGIPAYSCAVMSTPFLARGYEIEWIDTNEYGVLDENDFAQKKHNISCIIVAHTFGFEANRKKIYEIAQQEKIFVIEDCAHLWNTDTEYCDTKLFSFGREKIISCVSGGAIIWKENKKLEALKQKQFPQQKNSDVIQLLLQPSILSIVIAFWFFGPTGKAIAWFAKKINLLPRAVTEKEKQGEEDVPITQLDPRLQTILEYQWEKRNQKFDHQKKQAEEWKKELKKIFPKNEIIVPPNNMQVTVKTQNAEQIKQWAQKQGYNLRDWDGSPIAPKGVNQEKFGYQKGMCKNAESFAQNTVRFPTHQRISHEVIQNFIKEWKKNPPIQNE